MTKGGSWFAILLDLFASILPVSAMAAKSVLVIESYHDEFQWDADYKEGLTEKLGADYEVTCFEMDTKRLPKDRHVAKADEAWAKYQEMKPDLVVLGDDAAMKYLADRFARTETPIVFLGINNNPRHYLPANADNFTGVLERPLLKRSVIYIRALLPGTKRVLALFDDDITSDIVKREVFDERDSVTVGDIVIDLKQLGSLDEWRDTVINLKDRYDAVVVGLYQNVKDATGRPVDPETLINWVSENVPIPPFAFWDFAIGSKRALGGLVLYGKEMGSTAADLVKAIMEEGKAPLEIRPVYHNQGLFLFSKTQLDKWKIELPAAIEKKARIIN